MQPTFAQLLVKCHSCRCTFCVRCSALYLPQPTDVLAYSSADSTAATLTQSTSQQQQQLLAAAAAALMGLLATCSCEAVDSRAAEQRWGPAAIAYWPTGQLQHQLLLLLLLQRHQQQAVPLLSKGLLQRLQDDWRSAESAVLTWQHVQAVAQDIAQQQQLRNVQLADPLNPQEQQQRVASDSLQVIPTAATSAFHAIDGRNSMPAHTYMDMEVCNGSVDTGQQRALAQAFPAAVAAAAAVRAASEPTCILQQRQQQHQQQLDHMQVDGIHDPHTVPSTREVRVPTRLQQQRQQEARLGTGPDAGVAVSADAAALLQAADGEELFALAREVNAVDAMRRSAMLAEQSLFVDHREQPWPAAAIDGNNHQPFVAVAVNSSDCSLAVGHQSQLHSNGMTEGVGVDDQLELEDFAEQPQPSDQQRQSSGSQEILSLKAQQQPVMRHVSAVLVGRRDKLRLVEAEAAAGRNQVVQDHPQLSDLGLEQGPPPVLPDDPVVLIDQGDNGDVSFW